MKEKMIELTTVFQKIGIGDETVYGGAAGHLELWAKYNKQDIPNNKHNVTVELRLIVRYGYIGNYQATYWDIEGDLSNNGNLGSGDYRSRTLGSVTGDITHNPDGTKTISFSGEFNPTAWGYSMEVEGNATLPTLHTPPEITDVSIAETNSVLTNLGITDNTIVQFLSSKKFTLTPSFFDDATLDTFCAYHNNVLIGTSTTKELTINFSNVSELIDSNTGYVGITFIVKDHLGGETSKIINYPVIKYTRPTVEATSTTIKRKTGSGTVLTDNKAILTFVGTCYKGNDVIGNANKPTVQFKIWNGTEPSYTTLTTPNSSNVNINNHEISNIIYTSVYNYKIKIYDLFTTSETNVNLKIGKVPTGKSVWTEYKDRVDFEKITKQGVEVPTKNEVQRHIVSAFMEKEWTTSFTAWNSVDMPINKATVIGDKLSFSDSQVVIGQGVSKVLVGGSVYFGENIKNTQIRAWVMQRNANGEDVFNSGVFDWAPDVDCRKAIIIPQITISVSAGDKISIVGQIGKTQSGLILARATSIYVEVIE